MKIACEFNVTQELIVGILTAHCTVEMMSPAGITSKLEVEAQVNAYCRAYGLTLMAWISNVCEPCDNWGQTRREVLNRLFELEVLTEEGMLESAGFTM